ncbi:Uncharacterised protein [Vibrio cholerae]|nr:Uncharacterised protein [Vibrio cholerae]
MRSNLLRAQKITSHKFNSLGLSLHHSKGILRNAFCFSRLVHNPISVPSLYPKIRFRIFLHFADDGS